MPLHRRGCKDLVRQALHVRHELLLGVVVHGAAELLRDGLEELGGRGRPVEAALLLLGLLRLLLLLGLLGLLQAEPLARKRLKRLDLICRLVRLHRRLQVLLVGAFHPEVRVLHLLGHHALPLLAGDAAVGLDGRVREADACQDIANECIHICDAVVEGHVRNSRRNLLAESLRHIFEELLNGGHCCV